MINLFTHHQYEIKERSFSLWFFGDMHFGTSSFDEDRFDYFLKKAKESENPYYLGAGDYSDFASMSENKKIKNADLHDTTEERLDNMAINDNILIARKCEQMRGRLIGLIGGNHQFTLSSGKMSDVDLSERLNTQYLGWLSIISLRFPNGKGDFMTLKMFGCHGKGGGKLMGSSINAIDDMTRVINNADVYFMGHDHQRSATPKTVLQIVETNGLTLKQKRQYLVRTGSFQKSYERDKSGFAQGHLMRPDDLGAVRLNISTHRNRKDEDRVILDIEAII